jgi:magnesium chelatase accessory protein
MSGPAEGAPPEAPPDGPPAGPPGTPPGGPPDGPPEVPPDWPHAAASRILDGPVHRWHVQEMGAGPALMLLHGAGGATQSFRALLPRLAAAGFRAIAVDLPGQGFTRAGRRDRSALEPTAEDLAALARAQGWNPVAAIGHSAGGALALALAERLPLRAVVGINAALDGFPGLAGLVFPAMARALTLVPFAPALFARSAGNPSSVRALLASTGSAVAEDAVALYTRLIADPAHVEGALAMMAAWRLDPLLARLPAIGVPVLLLTGDRDRTVPPATSARAAARMPDARVVSLPGLGHLMHEEDPATVLAAILPFLAQRLG